MRVDGLTAPDVIDGAMDGPAFMAYIVQVLAPTLVKDDIVLLDNLRTHKVNGVAAAIAAVGETVRHLPAYSPDLNPIEMAVSKLKTALRKGAKRTVKDLWRLIGTLVKSFAPEECANDFRHAGYHRWPTASRFCAKLLRDAKLDATARRHGSWLPSQIQGLGVGMR